MTDSMGEIAGSHPYTVDNEVFAAFLFYGGIVLLKILAMSPLTILYRMGTNSYMNLEDTKFPVIGEKDPEKQKRALVPSEAVSRVRRAHANDIENIVPFSILSMMYIATRPDVAFTLMLFKVFAYVRIAHTFVYLFAVPQPMRFLTFFVGMTVNVFMALEVIKAAY